MNVPNALFFRLLDKIIVERIIILVNCNLSLLLSFPFSVSGKFQKETNVIKAGNYSESVRSMDNAEPLQESFRPRKDGQGGE